MHRLFAGLKFFVPLVCNLPPTARYFRMMKLAVLLLVAAWPVSAQVEDNRVVTRRFAVGGTPEVVVSVINGGIRVTAHSGSEVILNAKVHYDAPDSAELTELQQQVRLETEQSGNNIWIGVEGDNWNRNSGRQRELGWRGKTPPERKEGRRWSFRHDIELQVPKTAHLKLSTVNSGGISVEGVAGEFSYNNVNGGIEVRDANGFGRAHTVNGPVTLTFQRNPTGPLSIKTINGRVELRMRPGLNAHFKMKTFNGQIFTDFPLTQLTPVAPTPVVMKDGLKRIWSSKGFNRARAGSGGPEIEIDGFNSRIEIIEQKN